MLPVGQNPETRVDSGTGMTPLIRADRLADELGFTAPIWVKDDSANPTHSFKDRVVSVAVTAARELGFERIACASTGNLGNSVAAHAARIGMPSIVFVPSDLEAPKIVQSAIYGGTLVGIEGSYDDVNRLCSELSETDEFEKTGFVNVNVRPYYAEGSKTLGFEVAEQLGWRIPAQYVAPMASGSMLTKINKSFKELVAAGLVPSPDVVQDRLGRRRGLDRGDDVAGVAALVGGQHRGGGGRRAGTAQSRGQHLVDRRVQPGRPRLDEPHERQSRDGFGERARRRDRPGGHRRARAQVREPGGGGPQLVARRHRDGDAGGAGDRGQPGQDGVQRRHHVVEHAHPSVVL